ncbi:MAG TPA: ABC transporter ATP-binding protein [Gemmatimonadaceae bacterium]|nr:ABC transporter ATP-binding protein [Gemmatimonadaceae bacterium]
MIRYERVVARYPRAPQPAVDDVTFSAPRRSVTAVVGPNGSGKSTLVRLLLRTLPIVSGTLLVDGVPIGAMDRREVARRVAVVPQREENVFPLPVRDYVALGRYPHESGWRAGGAGTADEAAIERAIILASVAPLAHRSTAELSGGEWQRVRIARALAQGAHALVLDEPTTFLDIAHEMAMFELFAALAHEGQAVLVVSHQLNLVARFADQLVLVHRGRLVAAGTPADVMRAPTLEQVYEWPLVITRDPAAGVPSLLPLRRGPRFP